MLIEPTRIPFDRVQLVKTSCVGWLGPILTITGCSRAPAKLSSWGYAEVRTKGGIGLIRAERARYEPTFDMTNLAVNVWFGRDHGAAAEKLLAHALACISIQGALRDRGSAEARAQTLNEWVVEMPTERDARTLAGYLDDGTPHGGRFIVGFANGRLFATLIAGSSVAGIAPLESRATLATTTEETRAAITEALSERP